MKTILYVPKLAQEKLGKDRIYEGTVELRPPTFDERLLYTHDLGVSVNEEGKVEKYSGELSVVQRLRKMVLMAKNHYVAVDLINLRTGAEYKSYEDLSMDREANDIITEIASVIIQGFSLGNASKLPSKVKQGQRAKASR